MPRYGHDLRRDNNKLRALDFEVAGKSACRRQVEGFIGVKRKIPETERGGTMLCTKFLGNEVKLATYVNEDNTELKKFNFFL